MAIKFQWCVQSTCITIYRHIMARIWPHSAWPGPRHCLGRVSPWPGQAMAQWRRRGAGGKDIGTSLEAPGTHGFEDWEPEDLHCA